MPAPEKELEQVRLATGRLLDSASSLSDADARGPSLLPGWSRGHVLTHLARNADAQRRMITGAVTDQRARQYPGGARGRAREIEAGSHRPASELLADLRAADGYRWCPHDESSGTSWRVTGVAVTPGHGRADASDAEISAAGWQLLAWLLGRGKHGIRTKDADDTGTALRLPEYFPFA